MSPDSEHRPDERRETENDINRGKDIILKYELEVGEGKIEDEIQDERQSNDPRQILLNKRPVKYLAERNRHECI